jgi:glutaredoxin
VFFSKYNRWYENDFKQEFQGVCLGDLGEEEEYEKSVEEKVKNFILSDTRTDFVVFTPEEALYVLSMNIETNESFDIENICLNPIRGSWQVYLKYKIGSISLPWVVMNVVKDNRETAEIYVNEIKVGDTRVPGVIEKKVMVDINRGMSDAVIMLNENRFLGRVIENIEFLDDKVVFKGST